MIHDHRFYPDPAVTVLNTRFNALRIAHASVEQLFGDCRWAEGPVGSATGAIVLWSDIPNNRIMRWDEETGATAVFRQPSNHANGNTRDRQGRLVTCEHLARRVTRTEYDGAITVLADRYQGKRAEFAQRRGRASPTVRSGSPTRPTASSAITKASGASRNCRQRVPHRRARPASCTWSADDLDGAQRAGVLARRVAAVRGRVARARRAASGCSTCRPTAAWTMKGTDRREQGRARRLAGRYGRQPVVRLGARAAASADGVRVFTAQGEAIGHVELPERCANVCFGGRHRNRLFMAAGHSLYSLYVNTQGAV